MAADPLPAPEPVTIPPRLSLAARLRNYLLAGVLVTAPISITVYFTWSVVTWVDDGFARVIPDAYNPNTYLPFNIPGLGILMLLGTLTLIGFMTANLLGRGLLRASEMVLARMPIIRSLYSTLKQIFETVLKSQSPAFRDVVLVEYPRVGMWTLALVIGRAEGEIRDKLPDDILAVYIPTTPNPTSGYLVYMPKADTIKLDMSIEDCLKLIISGGLVGPKKAS